ncbi:MAG: hypothetical protein ABL903_07775 [Methylococcales bacterium]
MATATNYKWKLSASPGNVLEGGIVNLKTTLFRTLHGSEVEVDIPTNAKVNYKYTIENGIDDSIIEEGCVVHPFNTAGLIAETYIATLAEVIVIDWQNMPIGIPIGVLSDVNAATARFSVMVGQVKAAVTMQRSGSFPTGDQSLWAAIRNRTSAIQFDRYQRFIDDLLCKQNFDVSSVLRGHDAIENSLNIPTKEQGLSIQGPYAYTLLKLATQVFLTLEAGVFIRDDKSGLFDSERESIRLNQPSVSVGELTQRLQQYLHFDNQALPYLDRIVTTFVGLDPSRKKEVLSYCYGVLQHRLTRPSLLELIWSYWQEEGMLIQTMNAITLRFQNMRSSPRDPLGELEIDPLRPLNNLLWGFIQDEQNRLTIPRRSYEYDHHYGLKLLGKAVPNLASADSRSKFIESFHNLLYRTAIFYREDSDTTVIADAFPLLNALKEVHLLLAEGAHNQFGDLPWTARAEMLTMQWLLARPEMREFLRGRHMVPYQEPWMGAVDCMKKLQGWTDTTVTHFHELAVTGERIILSIRYGDWSNIDNIDDQAKNWARYWKPEIQRYMHDYQTATGVDLMADVIDSRDASLRLVQPSVLLQRRLAGNAQQGRIPTLTRETVALTSQRSRIAEISASGQGRFLKQMKDI